MNFSSKSLLAFVAVLAVSIGSAAGCGNDDDTSGRTEDTSSSSSGGESTSSSGGSSGGSSSSGGTSSSSSSGDASQLPLSCDDACRTLALNIVNGQRSGTFDEAQYGFNGDGTLHVEMAFGGPAGCPTAGSADPEYMLVATVTPPTDRTPLERGAGLSTSVLAFGTSDMVEGFPPPKSTSGTLTPTAGSLVAGADGFFAFDIQTEFEGGITVDGHVFATHCASLDER